MQLTVMAGLADPAARFPRRPACPGPVPRHVDPGETQAVAERFLAARTTADPLVALAYQQLETQTDQQFAALTDPHGPYRITVAATSEATPYADAGELITSVLASRTLEVTTSPADRAHPLLGRGVLSLARATRPLHRPCPPGRRHRAARRDQRAMDHRPGRRAQGGAA
jgi:hypothetical protein